MKWPWTRSSAPAESVTASHEAALRALDDRLRAVEAQLSSQTASLGLIRVEWAEVLDKVNRWASRQAGRLSRQAKESLDAAADAPEAAGATIPQQAGVGRLSKDELRRMVYRRQLPNGGGS